MKQNIPIFTLEFPKVGKFNQGKYTCIGQSVEMEEFRANSYLNVRGWQTNDQADVINFNFGYRYLGLISYILCTKKLVVMYTELSWTPCDNDGT